MSREAVRGAGELERILRGLPVAIRDEIATEVEMTAQAVVEGARIRAPVGGPYYGKKADTRTPGTLRRSIRYSILARRTAAVITVPGVFYAKFIEYGTIKMTARPFLFPAAEQEVPKFHERCREALRRAVRDANAAKAKAGAA
jgi:HK97 gp10 family phage protein